MKSTLLGAIVGAAALIASIGSATAATVTINSGDGPYQNTTRSGYHQSDNGGSDNGWSDNNGWHHGRHHRSHCFTKVVRTMHHGTMIVERSRICR